MYSKGEFKEKLKAIPDFVFGFFCFRLSRSEPGPVTVTGHSSEAVTRRYINRMDDMLQVAVDKLNGQFSAIRRHAAR